MGGEGRQQNVSTIVLELESFSHCAMLQGEADGEVVQGDEVEGMEIVSAAADQQMSVVLHEDKKYYPTADEVYGPDVEVRVLRMCLCCILLCLLICVLYIYIYKFIYIYIFRPLYMKRIHNLSLVCVCVWGVCVYKVNQKFIIYLVF